MERADGVLCSRRHMRYKKTFAVVYFCGCSAWVSKIIINNSTQPTLFVCDVHLSLVSVVLGKVPDVRFYKQTGDINKIPWSGLFGTGGYIAPEIMSQQPFGKPADLW